MSPVAWVRAIRGSDLLGPRPAKSLVLLGRTVARYGPSLFAVVAWRAAEDPDRVAVIEGELEFSYRQLRDSADAMARWLLAHRVNRSGRRMALWCQRPAVAVLALLAAQRLGVDVVLLNTTMSTADVDQVVERSDSIVVSDDPRMGDLHLPAPDPEAGLVAPARGETDQEFTGRLPRTHRMGRISILSSGTTGVPRPVGGTTSLGGLDTLMGFVTLIGARRHERARVLVPLFHGHGLGTVQLGLALAGTLTLRSPTEQRATGYASDWAATGVTDLIVGVPTVLRRLIAARPDEQRGHSTQARSNASAVRAIITGSATLDEATLIGLTDAFGQVVHNIYGTSETGVISHAGPSQLAVDPCTVGSVLPGLHCQIRDADGHSLATGQVGQVWVRGAVVGRRWRATGDLGSMDAPGWLRLHGRADDTLVVGAELVVPEALEARIGQLEGVAECAVRGIPDPEYGTRIELVVRLAPGSSVTHLRTSLTQHLPRTLRPVSIIAVDELPRTATGKLQRHRLPTSRAGQPG